MDLGIKFHEVLSTPIAAKNSQKLGCIKKDLMSLIFNVMSPEFLQINFVLQDHAKFPLLKGVTVENCDFTHGEILLIPTYYRHWVKLQAVLVSFLC